MRKSIVIIIIALLNATAFACDCDWGGDFFTMAKQTDFVAKVRVAKKIKDSNDFNVKMEVEILEVYKGIETRKIITVWGDDGKECRPYIDYFDLDELYYLSLYKYDDEYEQMNCGEMYLKIYRDTVIGEKGIVNTLPQIGKMHIKEFETQLKYELKQPEKYKVLNKDSLEYIPWVVKEYKSTILTKKEEILVDSLFQDFKLKKNNGDSTIQAMGEIGLMEYKRQYLPVLNEKNEKIIWINCFCSNGSKLPNFAANSPDKWGQEVIIVKDGGNCYFSVFLNLKTKEFYQLMVNGI